MHIGSAGYDFYMDILFHLKMFNGGLATQQFIDVMMHILYLKKDPLWGRLYKRQKSSCIEIFPDANSAVFVVQRKVFGIMEKQEAGILIRSNVGCRVNILQWQVIMGAVHSKSLLAELAVMVKETLSLHYNNQVVDIANIFHSWFFTGELITVKKISLLPGDDRKWWLLNQIASFWLTGACAPVHVCMFVHSSACLHVCACAWWAILCWYFFLFRDG